LKCEKHKVNLSFNLTDYLLLLIMLKFPVTALTKTQLFDTLALIHSKI